MRRSKRRTVEVTKRLMNKPKWWNQAFARYDQKRLYKWAAKQRTFSLQFRSPELPVTTFSLGDRLVARELYKPYIVSNDSTKVVAS